MSWDLLAWLLVAIGFSLAMVAAIGAADEEAEE